MAEQKTLFKNVSIIDGSGAKPYKGQVLVEGNRIKKIAKGKNKCDAKGAVLIDGGGKTLMPGMCDAHLHLTWNDQPSLEAIIMMPPEEHVIHSVNVAKTVLDSGFTSGFGAASARPRLDCVLRDAIRNGDIVGPRYLAASQEITTLGGLADSSPPHIDIDDLTFGYRVTGPEEMRKAVRQFIKYGVDNVKMNLSGEAITPVAATESPMSDEEVAMAMSEVRRRNLKGVAHARSAESVKMCVRHGIEIIYHASYIDEEGLDMLEAEKDRFFLNPALAWLHQTAYAASDYGIPPGSDIARMYEEELEIAIEGMKKAHARGIRVLPGGDYGFAWLPHGTNATDLQYFVELLGFSPMDTIVSATKMGGEIMGQGDELGLIKEGYLADILVVDGDPLKDIKIMQDHNKLNVIMQDGKLHKITMH